MQMGAEKAFVEWLAKEGRVVVHETTCYGVRECGGSSTFDASCHWNSSGRYVCLRCLIPPCKNLPPTNSHLSEMDSRPSLLSGLEGHMLVHCSYCIDGD